MSVGWRTEEREGIELILCEALEEVAGIAHAFSTRRADGGESFDLGTAVPAGDAESSRRRRFLRAAGFGGASAYVLRQVHGAAVVRVGPVDSPPEADAAISILSGASGLVPSVRTADCVPVLLADRRGRAAAAVHAGWRGTSARIVVRSVEALAAVGVPADEVVAALGPAIRACCYEVGQAVFERVAAAAGSRDVGEPGAGERPPRLDLARANRAQLLGCGVRSESIHVAPWCTACRPDLFFSYRRDGRVAGRQMSSVGAPACG